MELLANKAFIFNSIGILGVILIVIAYFMVQTGKLKPNSLAYPTLNFVGATLHLISLVEFWNLASFIIEIFWVAISVYGFYSYFKAKKA